MTLTLTHAQFADLDKFARDCDWKWPVMQMREYLHQIARSSDEGVTLDDSRADACTPGTDPTIH